MNKGLRKILLSLFLALFTVATCGLCLVSCSKGEALKITFKKSPYTYERGIVADAYDMIEREEGVSYTFAYSYLTKSETGETVSSLKQEMSANTIYLSEASRYTLYVTATREKESVSDSTEFDVIGESPVLFSPSLSIIYNIGTSAKVKNLRQKASLIALPSSSKIEVDYYTYQENQAPTLSASTNAVEKIRVAVKSDDDKINFNNRGVYEFHVVATYADKKAEGFFIVKVLPDQTLDVDGVGDYKNAEFGENDTSIVRLVGSSDTANASYVVLEENFKDGQVAQFEFYGSNMPSYIGIFNQDYNISDKNSMEKGGLGYLFTSEYPSAKGQTRLYGYTRKSGKTDCLKNSEEKYPLEHFDVNVLEENAHYFFEISCQSTGELSDRTSLTNKGIPNYGCKDDAVLADKLYNQKTKRVNLYFSLYKVEENGSYTIIGHSSTKYESGIGSWFLENEEVQGKLVIYSSVSKDITFKYHKDALYGEDFDQTACYYNDNTGIFTWEPVENAKNYVIATAGNTSSRIAVVDANTTSFDFTSTRELLKPFEGVAVEVYASTGNNTFSQKKYKCILTNGNEPDGWGNAFISGNLNDYDATNGRISVSLAGTKAQNFGDYQVSVDYVAFNETYTLDEKGTYVDVYFTGNNMPQVEFFANDALGNIANQIGDTFSKGFVVTNGHAHQSAYKEEKTGSKGGYSNHLMFYKYGVTTYNRLVDGNSFGGAVITDTVSDGTFTYIDAKDGVEKTTAYSNFSMYSLMVKQSETQKYRYTVGMFKSADGSVWIDSKLYTLDNTTETLFAEWLSSVNISAEQSVLNSGETLSGKIVLHASYKGLADIGENYYTKFSCSKPYAGDAQTIPLVNNGTRNSTTGEISLNGGNVQNGSNKTTNTGYLAFTDDSEDGKFTLDSDGTYVDFYFTGNNMPNVEFFGSSISGNVFSDGANTGYIVSNGHGPATLYRNYAEVKENGLINNGDIASAYETGKLTYNPISYKFGGITNYGAFFTYSVSTYNKYDMGANALQYERSNSLPIAYYQNSAWTSDYAFGYSDFSMYSLMNDETKQWHYVVGMYLTNDNQVWIDSKLFEIGDDTTETLVASYNVALETLNTGVVRRGYIIAHSAFKGTQDYTTNADYGGDFYTKFTYTAPYAGDASARV